ncbi:hypothetical protein [Pseudomonas fildesensis]|uniref:Uncharacterized protein n=1 Tax=Pseudomonas fildesensis TaxID=1674920 RepID=A0A0J8G3L2_9PSED|nr:hypothetical protein [Pseudomonas fildesensis]KMT57102.1 hypothetical protein ACR52_00335 [Pseudomonas fildesensis]
MAEYSPHPLAPAEQQKLAQNLAPLLRVANSVWLLSEGGSKRHVLLVLASQRWVSRLAYRLTGEENPFTVTANVYLTNTLSIS